MNSVIVLLIKDKLLLSILDNIFSYDAFDLRSHDQGFSFFSAAGLIVITGVVILTGQSMNSALTLECSTFSAVFSAENCVIEWGYFANLLLVFIVFYVAAKILDAVRFVPAAPDVIMEKTATLFVFSCIVVMLSVVKLEVLDESTVFSKISDYLLELFGTSGDTNNVIAMFLLATATVLISFVVTLARRIASRASLEYRDLSLYILIVFYIASLSSALITTFDLA
jgi:hypothetical protein